MGRKLNQASMKICKSENKKQLNSLIKVLRPKVYITDSSNFKNLVQQLTGNISNPISFNPPSAQEPAMDLPIMEIENHDYSENSLESSYNSSEDSLPSSFTSLASSPQEGYVSETTFNVLESSFASNSNIGLPSNFQDIESWLLDIGSFSCDWDAVDDHIPPGLPEVSVYGFDFADLL